MTASFMYPAYVCSCPFAFPVLISVFRARSWFPILASNTLWYDWFVIGITALTYFPGVFPVISRPIVFAPLACRLLGVHGSGITTWYRFTSRYRLGNLRDINGIDIALMERQQVDVVYLVL